MTVQEWVKGLRDIGYSLYLEEENIRFKYGGEGEPPEDAALLLTEAKSHKKAIINFLKEEPFPLIEQTLSEINDYWEPGALDWSRRFQHNAIEKMVAIEQKINRWARDGNIEALKEALSQYRSHIFSMVEESKKAKGTAGTLFE